MSPLTTKIFLVKSGCGAGSNVWWGFGRGLKKKVQDPFTRKDWYGVKVSRVILPRLEYDTYWKHRLLPCSLPESKAPIVRLFNSVVSWVGFKRARS